MSEADQQHSSHPLHPAQSLAALLVAGGSGSRLGGDIPKQFQDFGGRPLLLHSLETLQQSRLVDRTIVVVPKDWTTSAQELLQSHKFAVDAVIAGGATRQESVQCGMAYLQQQADKATHVLIHDAARPFVSTAMIRAVVAAVHETGAATLAVPISDTLMRSGAPDGADSASQQHATESVDRNGMWAVQTPQVFELSLLQEAHDNASATSATASAPDDGSLVLALGRRVTFVPGAWWNFKLTRPEDFEKARLIAATRRLRSMQFAEESQGKEGGES